TPETAIVRDKQRIWQPGGRCKRVLVRVEGYSGLVTRSGGIRRHIGKARPGVLRALDVAAIRPLTQLAVLRCATDIYDIWRTRGRPDRHIIGALSSAVIE